MLTFPPDGIFCGDIHLKVLFKLDAAGSYTVHIAAHNPNLQVGTATIPVQINGTDKLSLVSESD